MKRVLLSLFTLVLLFAFSSSAQAILFEFSGTDKGGIGSADMNISIVGNALTALLDNTSPTSLELPLVGENSPGITGFGFDLTNDPDLTSWSLTAYLSDLSGPVTIASKTMVDSDWIMGSTLASVTLDYLPTNEGTADGMLFNPAAFGSSLLPGGSNDVFFTRATLTMIFDGAPVLDTDNPLDTPFVRMQNVGEGADGSLKLYDGDGGWPPQSVPEPATMLLLGCGFIGIAVSGKKRFKR